MGIGASVFLLALGAILAFAVTDAINGVDLTAVGYILMVAGAVGLLMTTLVFGRRDAGDRVVTTTRERDVL